MSNRDIKDIKSRNYDEVHNTVEELKKDCRSLVVDIHMYENDNSTTYPTIVVHCNGVIHDLTNLVRSALLRLVKIDNSSRVDAEFRMKYRVT